MTVPVSANEGPSPLSGRPGGEGKPVVLVDDKAKKGTVSVGG